MFLSLGMIKEDTHLYRWQRFVQTVLLLIMAICVPWMLCVKLYLIWKETMDMQRDGYSGLSGSEVDYGVWRKLTHSHEVCSQMHPLKPSA